VWQFRKKKIKHRRLEVRKDISADSPTLWERFRTCGGPVSLLLGLGFWITVLLLDICPLDPLPYRQGQYIPGDIRARVRFGVPSRTRIKDLARELTPATFVADGDRINSIVSIIRSLPGKLEATTQPADLDNDLRQQFALNDETLAAWRAMLDESQRDRLDNITKSLKTGLEKVAIASEDQVDREKKRRAVKVELKGSGLIEKSDLIAQNDTARVSAAAGRLARESADGVLVDSLQTFLTAQLVMAPLCNYDDATTEAHIAQKEKEMGANPPEEAHVPYERGEIVVDRTPPSGRPGAPLEGDELARLAREHRAWLAEESIAGPWARAAGRAIQILMVTVLLCLYIARYQGRIIENHMRGLAVVVVLLVMLAMSRIMVSALGWNPHSAVLTVVMISCVMAITYNQRFAMAIGSVLAILVTLQLRGDFGMLIVMFASVMPCAFLLREVRTRGKLIEASAISASIVFTAVWFCGAEKAHWLAFVDGLWAGGFALLAGVLLSVLPWRTVTGIGECRADSIGEND